MSRRGLSPSIRRPAAVVAGLALAAGCSGGGDTTAPAPAPVPTVPTAPAPGRGVVTASASLAFSPAELTVAVGDTVAWVFGAVAHTVTFQSEGDSAAYYGGRTSSRGAPAGIPGTANGSVARVFAARGSFSYRCTIHPGMAGEVRVQ